MNTLNNSPYIFESANLKTSGTKTTPPGAAVVTYINSSLTNPMYIDVDIYIGTDQLTNGADGLLNADGTTITVSYTINYISGSLGGYESYAESALNNGIHSHYARRERIFLPANSYVNVYVESDGTDDFLIDGVVYITETMSGGGIETVGGESPITVTDILQDSGNPSVTPSPISVDQNGRIIISGDNNNILDDFVDINGRVNISKR